MKIDCPHCEVQGFVDDSLAGKKLRCPECSKVFLIAEEFLPDVDDSTMIHQEKLADENTQLPEPNEETVAEEKETAPVEAESEMEECSVCKQSFISSLMIEVDSKLYCALCQPDSEEEELDFSFGEDSAEEDLGLMDDMSDEDIDAETDDFFALMDAGEEDGDEESDLGLEPCAGCGEAFHPDFMKLVGSKRYCALCTPEDAEIGGEAIEELEVKEEDSGLLLDEIFDDKETDDSSVEALLGQIDEADQEAPDGSDEDICSVCGEKFHRDFLQEVDAKLYCGVCQPQVVEETSGDKEIAADNEEAEFESEADFSVGELLKEAWQQTKGVKGTIWGALAVMILIVSTLTYGGIAASQSLGEGSSSTTLLGVTLGSQLVSNWISMLMTGGIMLIGVRSALGQRVSWRMVFAGFSKWLSMTIAIILQTILVLIGFALLIIPGIYLTVGYALALPLILDKGMGPWEALEASRKAIHKKWWTVFGAYVVMTLLAMIATIPAGLGLIWIVPMYFVLIGVLYVRLFGGDESVAEDLLEELEDESEDDLEEESSEEIAEETEDEIVEEQAESPEETKEPGKK